MDHACWRGAKCVYKIRMGNACWKGALMGIQNTNGSCLLERDFDVYTKYEWVMVIEKGL